MSFYRHHLSEIINKFRRKYLRSENLVPLLLNSNMILVLYNIWLNLIIKYIIIYAIHTNNHSRLIPSRIEILMYNLLTKCPYTHPSLHFGAGQFFHLKNGPPTSSPSDIYVNNTSKGFQKSSTSTEMKAFSSLHTSRLPVCAPATFT